MRRYRKNRINGDCDSLYSHNPSTPMSFGCIPIDMNEDYGKNSIHYILRGSKLRLYMNWPHNVEESDAYFIVRMFKI